MISFTVGTEPGRVLRNRIIPSGQLSTRNKKVSSYPSTAILKCQLDSAKFECVWEVVNEPLEIVQKTATRYANVLPKLGSLIKK